jgi:4-amino-4-deoxy-L-arabinose transferase-like glycosyltransferase
MSRKPALIALAILVVAYLFIATSYAINTPLWQAPDEPAHYNTVRFIAEHGALPVLQSGDYDAAYNAEFTRTPQNAQSMSIDPFRYEFYSPPLYYLLASPIYSLTNGSIITLRLFSVALSAVLIIVAFFIGAELFPDRLHISIGAAAFVAFVPQHVAMMSAVNNDSLAELLIALCVWQSMRLFKLDQPARKSFLLLGITLGLGLLTKQTIYYTALPIVAIAVFIQARKMPAASGQRSAKEHYSLLITHYALVFLPALLLGAILWLHNLQVYGGLDVLGLARHNSIVVGQPTSAEWIAQYGLGGLIERGLTTTFHSFWGQFGWMAVPMQNSDYLMVGVLSLVALIGWMWWVFGGRRDEGGGMKKFFALRPPTVLLILLFILTVGGFIYYNLTFVQHQGRYVFPALIPIGLMVSIGLDHILQKLFGLIKNQSRWIVITQFFIFALVFVYLARLDMVALQRYIIPVLSP